MPWHRAHRTHGAGCQRTQGIRLNPENRTTRRSHSKFALFRPGELEVLGDLIETYPLSSLGGQASRVELMQSLRFRRRW
jgi:hypothetical protein